MGTIRALVVAAAAALCIWLAYSYSSAVQQAAAAHMRVEAHRQAAEAWELDAYQARLDLYTCQQQFTDAKQTFDEQLAQAEKNRGEAAREVANWKAQWDVRSAECSVVVAALDAACPEAEGY